ncbi:hypothetical protein BHC44_01470 [Snodgrassella alvi]|jgi:NADP-dependent 3-hydroxy acid dehydrogenase YdfG|nr:hypothetical protein BHC44_01470 [Snodgrassella alvi]
MIDVNLKEVLNGMAAVMPIFTRQKFGHIITIYFIVNIKSFMGCGVYGVTKFAVRNLIELTQQESATKQTNIRTTTLYPAAINSELLQSITDATLQSMTELYKQVGISPDGSSCKLCYRTAR